MKKKLIMGVLFSIFLLLSPSVKAVNFTDNQTVDVNKTWTIKFTDEVEFDDATKQGITVTNSKGNTVDVSVQLGQDGKTVAVTAPEGGYTKGESYILNIGMKVHSRKGKSLRRECKVHFNIENDDGLHNKNEIIKKWNKYKPSFDGNIFLEKPNITAPYKAGKLNPDFINDGLKMTNFVRYLAGVPDDVTIDDALTNQAQCGAVILYHEFSHQPSKPDDMDGDFYELAYASTSSSNLGMGYSSLDDSVRRGYMRDADASNIDRVGHRRWILNPSLQKIAFGFVGDSYPTYTTMQVFDRSRTENINYEYVAWPNKEYFPTSFLSKYDPWSISLNLDKYQQPDINTVTVTITRKSDGRIWSLDKTCNSYSMDGNYFNVNNDGYGIPVCIIFRPGNVDEYLDGDEYSVLISGLKNVDGEDVQISYSVDFFNLE